MSIQKLTKMERKYRILQEEQNAILKRMQEEKRNAKKRLESERYNYIIQVVKRLKLPIDNPTIIIGALVEAKKIITENNTAKINEYIEKYSLFIKETEQIDIGDIEKNSKNEKNDISSSSLEAEDKEEYIKALEGA
ncbi:hypothetical protein GXM21_12665 (plasmid) [Megamonas funiformis]|uniref:DUF3847 domain-containing protein n=1 Tax=Megamonas funiformis YIT 11815 TaxID=742816 RepID=A0ABN0EF46_9FIRM|nr:hypothetical protein [Megamonas funiformis]EHR31885.1 hypothetical protein HMPREF9454_02448 [Megamonas funiformis YIT 11815]QIB61274.1 hypothetical protein GXM21_12665 [Megamonas funiformis]